MKKNTNQHFLVKYLVDNTTDYVNLCREKKKKKKKRRTFSE